MDSRAARTVSVACAIGLASLRPLAALQVPAGYQTYDSLASEFTIALPQGWSAFDQAAALGARTPAPFSMVIFSSVPMVQADPQQAVEVLGRVATGEIPSFFVQRQSNDRHMSCAGLTEKGEKRVFKLVRDTEFGRGTKAIEPLRQSSATIGGCQGIRLYGRVQARNGAEWIVEVNAVSNGATLYLFSLRNTAAHFQANAEAYTTALSTLHLAVADVAR